MEEADHQVAKGEAVRAWILILSVLVFGVAVSVRANRDYAQRAIAEGERRHATELALIADQASAALNLATASRAAIDAKAESCHHRADLLADTIEQISQWIPGRAHAPMTLAESRKR